MGLYNCIPDMEKIKQENYFLIYSSSPSLRLRYSPRRRRRTVATSYVAEVRPVRGSTPLTDKLEMLSLLYYLKFCLLLGLCNIY
jgi:hypothetical protein